MEKKKILVIDDEEVFCELIKESLELRGEFEVISATNGRQGIDAATESQPSLILLDLRLPIMHGYAVLDRLKNETRTSGIPVILVTGSEKEDEAEARASDMKLVAYLTKPVKIPDLLSKINELIRKGEEGAR